MAARARAADSVVIDTSTAAALLGLISAGDVYAPVSQSWGLVFRLLQHANFLDFFASGPCLAQLARALAVSSARIGVVA